MSIALSILKILDGQPDGRASLELVKRYLAIFYTSGPEWTARMRLLAEQVPELDIFSQKLVAREPGEWRITDKGRAFLTALERQQLIAGTSGPTLDDLMKDQPRPDIAALAAVPQRHAHDRKRRRGRRRQKARDRRTA